MKKIFLPVLLLSFSLASFAQNTNNCDVITLKSGKLIYCKVVNAKGRVVDYKECNDPSGIIMHIKSDSVTMINHPDGSYQMVEKGHTGGSNGGPGQGPHTIVSVNGGASFPVGSYGDKSLNISLIATVQGGGCANTGPDLNAYVSSFLNAQGNTGITILFGYTKNSFDFPSFFNGFAEYNQLLSNPVSLNSYSASFYTGYRLMAGPALEACIGKLRLDFNLLGGAYFFSYSGASYTYTVLANSGNPAQTVTTENPSGNSTKGGMNFIISGRYPLTEKLCIQLSAGFVFTSGQREVSSWLFATPFQYYFGNIPVFFINGTGGLVYQF